MKFNSTKLNKAINKSGKNVPAISKEADIPITTLYDWVNGRAMPRVDGMSRVAKCLGVRIEDLI